MNLQHIIQQEIIEYNTVENFYKLLISLSDDKKQIVIDNLYTKLSNISIKKDNDLPF